MLNLKDDIIFEEENEAREQFVWLIRERLEIIHKITDEPKHYNGWTIYQSKDRNITTVMDAYLQLNQWINVNLPRRNHTEDKLTEDE